MPTPKRATTGIPTPKPTPRAVVFVFFAGSMAGVGAAVEEGLEVADVLLVDADEPTKNIALVEEPLVDALGEDAVEEEAEEAMDVWVCTYDSPIMVTVYTSAGDCAKVKISDPELTLQSQPS